MSDTGQIYREVPPSVWNAVKRAGVDLAVRGWVHDKWYEMPLRPGGGNAEQLVLGTDIPEVPYRRDLFFTSDGRYAPQGVRVAYFGTGLPVATAESQIEFRNNGVTNDELFRYFGNELARPLKGYGFPLDVVVSESVTVVDVRLPRNPLFEHLAIVLGLGNGAEYATGVAMSRENNCLLQTQLLAAEAIRQGYDGIWYRSVGTPSGTFVTIGECLVLFERAEAQVRFVS